MIEYSVIIKVTSYSAVLIIVNKTANYTIWVLLTLTRLALLRLGVHSSKEFTASLKAVFSSTCIRPLLV